MMKKIFLLIGVSLLFAYQSTAQTKEVSEMKVKLNEDGSHYLKATFLNQIWLRFDQSNPGTQVLSEPVNNTFDIGLRRTRIQFFGQLTDHVFFYTQFGQNNFNYLAGQNATNTGNRKFQVFFHDALGEYKVWKDKDLLFFGSGLTITNGLSRFSQPSIGTIVTMDVPIFAQATVDQTDEFSRKLSVYMRGQLGKIDYRLVLSDPFPITSNGQPAPVLSNNATFSQRGHHKQYQGFFAYNFFDKESHTTPYMTGTYLGKKKVLNLEAGFITQQKGTWTRETVVSDTAYHNVNLLSVALYYDAPLNKEKGTALSAYAGYFDYDFGTGYLRYNGIMNPATSITGPHLAGSQGNAFPMFGTGSVIYAQLGYLMKKDLLGEGNGTLLPYVSIMSADWDRLLDRMNVIDAGVNWLIKEHSAKLTLNYQHRPYFETQGNDLVKKGNRGQMVMQYQIFF
jgi:hypothetical protein